MSQTILSIIKKQFIDYKILAEKAIVQMEDQHLYWKPNATSNSVANIVMHMHGNMVSRWTNFLTEDGEKEWRKREEEFEIAPANRDELLIKWNEGWQCLFDAIEASSSVPLDSIIYIRNQPHTILSAFLRQLAHYPSHIGQIIYLSKMLSDQNWKSLSIPKGGTEEFNKKMFEK
jgi:hypothetical protein